MISRAGLRAELLARKCLLSKPDGDSGDMRAH